MQKDALDPGDSDQEPLRLPSTQATASLSLQLPGRRVQEKPLPWAVPQSRTGGAPGASRRLASRQLGLQEEAMGRPLHLGPLARGSVGLRFSSGALSTP